VTEYKEAALDSQNFFIGKNLESKDGNKIDLNQIEEIYDDDQLMEEFKDEAAFEVGMKEKKEEPGEKGKKKLPTKSQAEIERIKNEEFAKEYKKVGGI
jgi:hypothetical protein